MHHQRSSEIKKRFKKHNHYSRYDQVSQSCQNIEHCKIYQNEKQKSKAKTDKDLK